MSEFSENYHLRKLAQALGLEHYEWLAYDYIDNDGPDEHPGVIEVT